MSLPVPRRRKKPKTVVGKVIRAWPKIMLALRTLRFVKRTRRVLKAGVIAGGLALVVLLVRKVRNRKREPIATYAPAPTPTVTPATPPVDVPGAGTREAGKDTGTGTETERKLAAEKAGGNGGSTPPHGDELAEGADVPPPVSDEPPTKT
jgi:hypothetical protein